MIEFLRNLFLHDVLLKLLSLALAMLVWLTVSFAIKKEVSPVTDAPQTGERTFYDLSVTVVAAAANVKDYRLAHSEVDVTVQGSPEVLRQLQDHQLRVMVDVSGVESATNSTRRIGVIAPTGITIARIRPAEVEVIPPAAVRTRKAPLISDPPTNRP